VIVKLRLKNDGEWCRSLIVKCHLQVLSSIPQPFLVLHMIILRYNLFLCEFLSVDSNTLQRNWWISLFCNDNFTLLFAYGN
jgi:hypothetical protein